VRQGVRQILEGRWEICGEAANGEEAIARAIELRPDLVLMDVSMPGVNGLEATKQIRLLGIPTKILIFSMHDSAQIALQAKAAGADGCLVKTIPVDELLKSIATILEGPQKR
jgi:DNA-binding NarL/FixJ family response regulator